MSEEYIDVPTAPPAPPQQLQANQVLATLQAQRDADMAKENEQRVQLATIESELGSIRNERWVDGAMFLAGGLLVGGILGLFVGRK